MAKEIERKYLVVDNSYESMAIRQRHLVQGYLSTDVDATVRVRIADDQAFITVKGRNSGCVRSEWEYEIPVDDAREMLKICKGKVIDKTRFVVPYAGLTWEVDRFNGDHNGLVVAEIELPSEDTPYELPPFVGEEVTGDVRYYNSSLSK